MRKLLLMPIIALLYCGPLFAQGEPGPVCPYINITGPPGPAAPGKTARFAVSIEPAVDNPQYEWTISDGKLLRGQGTPQIDVEVPQTWSLAATVSIKGLPAGCPDMATELMHWDPPPQALKLDEFTSRITEIEPGRIERIRRAIDQNPDSRFLVCAGFESKKGDAARRQRIGELAEALRESNYEWRFTFVTVESDRDYFQIWIVPAGADMPVCEE